MAKISGVSVLSVLEDIAVPFAAAKKYEGETWLSFLVADRICCPGELSKCCSWEEVVPVLPVNAPLEPGFF